MPRTDPRLDSGRTAPVASARRSGRPGTPRDLVALLDPDGVLAVSVGQSLAALGLTVVRHRDIGSLLESVALDPPVLVLLATRSGTRRVRNWTRTVRRGGDAPPVAWWCVGSSPIEPPLSDERPEALLFSRGDLDAVAGMVWRATRQPMVRDRWSGNAFLGRLRGDIRRYPPFRLLFLAHRVGASGELTVECGGSRTVVALRGGTVVDVRGARGLLGAAGGPSQDLAVQVGGAIASGIRPDLALDLAAEGLGTLLAGWLDTARGVVAFSGTPSPAAVPLTMPLPRMLTRGLAAHRSIDEVERLLTPLWSDHVRPSLPDDSSPDRWGVDSLARGLLRRAEGRLTLDQLVGPDRRPEALRSVDLLLALGLIRVEATLPPVTRSPRPSVSRRASPPERPAPERPGRGARRQPPARLSRSTSFDTGPPDSPEADAEPVGTPVDRTPVGQVPTRRRSDFHFEARFLGIQALAAEGTTSPRVLIQRLESLQFPEGERGANAAFEAGEIALAAGDQVAAVEFYHQAQRRKPDHEGARRRLHSRRLRTLDLSGSTMSPSASTGGETTLGDMIDDWFDRWRS